jgi:hypothetical protein
MSELEGFLAETVTHIYRRDDGTWRLVHRHGGGGPHPE